MKGIPIYFNIENKTVIVVGGETAAAIKIKKLIDFEADIVVIAPKICKEIYEYGSKNFLKIKQKEFYENDLCENSIVVCAADNKTNEFVYQCANERNLICCVCSKNLDGDFLFPSHKKRGDIIVTASTSGKYPLLSKKICEEINLDITDYLDFLEQKRNFVVQKIQSKKDKKKILNEFIQEDNYKYADRIENILKRYLDEENS